MTRRLNILAVGPHLPRSDYTAGDRRFVALLGMLARRHRVDLYPLAPWHDRGATRHVATLRGVGVRVLPGAWWAGLEQALLGRTYDVGFFEFWESAERGAERLRRHQPWAKVVVDTVDVHFLRAGGGLAFGVSDPGTVATEKQRELAVYRRADAVIVLTREDLDALMACGGVPRPYLIPIVASVRPRPAGPRKAELLFIGGFDHAPNVDGIVWFAREIWPRIRAERPEACVTIVGSRPKPPVMDLARIDGIEVVGYAPETAPYLDRAALLVAPLRFGAGMKGKVVEALASGLPVVTTSVGGQGLEATSGEHLMIADEPDAFSRRVVELLGDPDRADRIGRAGQGLVTALCAPGAAEARLEELLDAVACAGTRPAVPPPLWVAKAVGNWTGRMARLPLRITAVRATWERVRPR